MKLMTEISISRAKFDLRLEDKIISLGSCFSDEIGNKLASAGFSITINPFGTLYNPISIAQSVARLDSGLPFCEVDCVQMGAGANKVCSFSHHTSFARSTKEDFLTNANSSLQLSSQAWKDANIVLITLGSAMVWRHEGRVVSNCLKRSEREFIHEMLTLEEISIALNSIVDYNPGKHFLFSISPIRYFSNGAHRNSISKALLLLALEPLLTKSNCEYFPAYELLLDELRDYRFYANDLVHPRDIAIDYIWARFKDFCIDKSQFAKVSEAEKAALSKLHRKLL